MSIADINNAATAMNQLKARYEGFLDGADDQIAARQAAYDGLAGNLINVVNGQMYFTVTVDPDEPNPAVNQDGGTFTTIKAAIEAAPMGSAVLVYLKAGKTHQIASTVFVKNRDIVVVKSGAGDNPVIAPAAGSNGASNYLSCLRFDPGATLRMVDVDIQFPPKIEEALPWNSDKALIGYHPGATTVLELVRSVVTGTGGLALTSAATGVRVGLTLNTVTLDGDITAVTSANFGVSLIGKHAVTLLNGAAITDGGTVGVNILQN